MTEAFRRYALPFLDRFPNRRAVRALWEHQPDLVPFLGPARLDLALMAAHEGDHARAMELIQAHYEETIRKGHRGHAEYVQGVAAHLGYALKSHSPGAEM